MTVDASPHVALPFSDLAARSSYSGDLTSCYFRVAVPELRRLDFTSQWCQALKLKTVADFSLKAAT